MNVALALWFGVFLVGVLAVQRGTEALAAVAPALLSRRGIRNNNPLNLRITDIEWKGKVPRHLNTDGEYEQFYFAVDGIRAGARDLKTKYARGLDTIGKILEVFAPRSENDTAAYKASVSKQTGIPADQAVNVPAHLFEIVSAMIVHENGGNPYPAELVLQGVNAA